VETVSFPNLTGSYDGQKKRDFHPITLVLHPETSEVSGTYNYDGCTGTITGNLEPNGGVYLRFHSAVHYVCLVPKDGPGPWRIQPVSNGGFDLVGPTTVVHGTGSSGTIAMTVYTYLPTSKLDAFRTSDRMIKIGKVAVDNVTDLLLETEVSASGKYVWHIDYNELGRELKGTNASRSHGDVKFQKQPDGAWTCTWWYQ